MSTWDKSTRQNLPAEKLTPVVVRTGVVGVSAQKMWDNPSNMPAFAKLFLTNKSGSPTTFCLYVVEDGGTPSDEDLIAKDVPLNAKETMSYPDGELLLPEFGELWVSAGASDSVVAYLQAKYYV